MKSDESEVLRLQLQVMARDILMESLVKHLLVAQACAGEPFRLRLRAQVIQTLARGRELYEQQASSGGHTPSQLNSVEWRTAFDDVADNVRGMLGA